MVRSANAVDKYFAEELKRLQTDYIDYYLMHMLTDIAAWDKLVRLGIKDWIARKKETGEIRNIGFSFHGNTEMFLQILDAYDWDFCQIQYNYVDEYSQAGVKGLQEAAKKQIPVIIMEPLRGGKLVDLLPEKAKNLMTENQRRWSPAEWAFRWLWNQPEVTCVLSGMNSKEMVEENVRVASVVQADAFTEEEKALLEQVKKLIGEKIKVGCTGCGYCLPCPQGVDIPGTFRCYNEMYTEKKGTRRMEYIQVIGLRKKPGYASQCIRCGKCEQHCPQHLSIRKLLKEAERQLRPLPYKAVSAVMRKFIIR